MINMAFLSPAFAERTTGIWGGDKPRPYETLRGL
jgi:hypothetical protein